VIREDAPVGGRRSLEGDLRRSVRGGDPAAALMDAWPALNDADPEWNALIHEVMVGAARLDLGVGGGTLAMGDAFATAFVDEAGHALRADAQFVEWLGEPHLSGEICALAARARATGRAIGVVTGSEGRPVSLLAVRAGAGGGAGALAAAPAASRRPGVLLAAFAPSRSSGLARRAAEALGLAPLEARIAEALLSAPNLETAAAAIGVGRETAKDALKRAQKRTGARNPAELVGRLLDLCCEGEVEPGARDEDLLKRAMGLTPAEAEVAAALARGDEAIEAAGRLGLSEATVKSYRRAIFAKTGVKRSRDLRRLADEVRELDRLSSYSEVVADAPVPIERLRVLRSGGRRIAFIDYGPASGAPLVVGHGYTTGRLTPRPLLERLHKAGFRVLVPQRPGFGLTSPAAGDYLAYSANDLLQILDHLRAGKVRLLMRDGGCATALEFALRYPGRLSQVVLLNPRTPLGYRPPPNGPMAAFSRFLLAHPGLVEPFAEMLRRQTKSALIERVLRRACSTVEADRRVLEEDPALLPALVRDQQGLLARTVRGFVDETRIFADGWSPPGVPDDAAWTIAWSGALVPDPDVRPWAGLPNLMLETLEGAGVLLALTHTDQLIALLKR
jgi:pimeloyl-ACP methyl ester carboxylesterase/DNA-binding CsgD family transcriptional regulator